LATIPAAWAVYFVSRNNSDNSQPFVTRMIDGYTEATEQLSKKSDLHVRMIEQAGEDRVLFMNTKPHEHVEMKFPEYVRTLFANFPLGVLICAGIRLERLMKNSKLIPGQNHERRVAIQRPSW
jgi:hypothetical protein